ncbi:MAG TPA: hypothetical protein VG122_14785, partial [Gemmata sp.]|nr:hypothetical protein [Gemmata sp.]
MIRPVLAVSSVLLTFGLARATDPKPLWEIDASGGNRTTGIGWLAFSPTGQAIATIAVQETRGERPEYHYQLHVWNSTDRKERFTADLGSGRTPHWGDGLASFPSEETILTGGQELTTRHLENGRTMSSQSTGGQADHTVWFVPDLRESFYLRRDPLRYGSPVELFYQSENGNDRFPGQFGQFRGGRGRYGVQNCEQTTIQPPRSGLQTETIAMNFGRTQIVAAFRDDTPASKPRHALVLYQIKTVAEFELLPIAEALNPHPGPVSAIAFPRNGRILATGGEDGSVCLWDVNEVESSWKPRVTVDRVSDHRVYALTFSQDWRMLAAVTWDKTKPNLLLLDGMT